MRRIEITGQCYLCSVWFIRACNPHGRESCNLFACPPRVICKGPWRITCTGPCTRITSSLQESKVIFGLGTRWSGLIRCTGCQGSSWEISEYLELQVIGKQLWSVDVESVDVHWEWQGGLASYTSLLFDDYFRRVVSILNSVQKYPPHEIWELFKPWRYSAKLITTPDSLSCIPSKRTPTTKLRRKRALGRRCFSRTSLVVRPHRDTSVLDKEPYQEEGSDIDNFWQELRWWR